MIQRLNQNYVCVLKISSMRVNIYERTFSLLILDKVHEFSAGHFQSQADCHVCHDIVKGKPLSPGHVVIPLCRQPY
jgi:hypothetical protein